MKYAIWFVLLLTTVTFAQQPKMVSIPEDQLTDQQKAALAKENEKAALQSAHGWVGLGKEVGEAVNSSLAAVTTQTDAFAKTGIGKVTVALVIWKVMGDQAMHVVGALIELLIFTPVFLWSYRKICMTRRIKTSSEGFFGKKTYEVVKYDPDTEFTPRIGHTMALAIFTIIWLGTLFSYSG